MSLFRPGTRFRVHIRVSFSPLRLNPERHISLLIWGSSLAPRTVTPVFQFSSLKSIGRYLPFLRGFPKLQFWGKQLYIHTPFFYLPGYFIRKPLPSIPESWGTTGRCPVHGLRQGLFHFTPYIDGGQYEKFTFQSSGSYFCGGGDPGGM
jgi:hypothetical protein